MSNVVFEAFLKNFLEIDIYFLSRQEIQYPLWKGAEGAHFSRFIANLMNGWLVIKSYRHYFKISNSLYREMEKLFNMIETFDDSQDTPTTPKDYASLLSNPNWRQIQNQAQKVCDQGRAPPTNDFPFS
ncbi:MAG TPA: hypothetical protein VIJ14_09055 [Rhabdochlamydiaceae bacterium]